MLPLGYVHELGRDVQGHVDCEGAGAAPVMAVLQANADSKEHTCLFAAHQQQHPMHPMAQEGAGMHSMMFG